MKIIKRSGMEDNFDIKKIEAAIRKANESVIDYEKLTEEKIQEILANVEKACENMKRSPSVEEIQDMVENQIMNQRAFNVARNYITYRYKRALVRKSNSTDEQILSLLECNNEEVKQENSNKNPTVNSVQRDYMAGEVSKDITRRFLLDGDIVEAHEQIDERGLTRTRGSHHRDLLARLGDKRHVAHERLVGRIAKTHVFKGNTALHLARQLGGIGRQWVGVHLGFVEQVEHTLRARQRALQRVKGKRQLRHGLGRLIDKLEERLEHADGHMPGNQHAAAHQRDHDLRQAADKAHRGTDGVNHKVGLGAHARQLLRSLVYLGRALALAVKRANH